MAFDPSWARNASLSVSTLKWLRRLLKTVSFFWAANAIRVQQFGNRSSWVCPFWSKFLPRSVDWLFFPRFKLCRSLCSTGVTLLLRYYKTIWLLYKAHPLSLDFTPWNVVNCLSYPLQISQVPAPTNDYMPCSRTPMASIARYCLRLLIPPRRPHSFT